MFDLDKKLASKRLSSGGFALNVERVSFFSRLQLWTRFFWVKNNIVLLTHIALFKWSRVWQLEFFKELPDFPTFSIELIFIVWIKFTPKLWSLLYAQSPKTAFYYLSYFDLKCCLRPWLTLLSLRQPVDEEYSIAVRSPCELCTLGCPTKIWHSVTGGKE